MKPIILTLTTLTFALSGIANANAINAHALNNTQYQSQVSHAPQTVTINQLPKLYDETVVKVAGTIIRALGDEKYELQDKTGKIVVEIDDDIAFASQLVGKSVIIIGETDVNKHGRIKLDADSVVFK